MLEALSLVGVSIAAFVSTAVDNLLLLVALKSSSVERRRQVRVGFRLSVLVVLLTGYGVSHAADLLPDRFTSWLGLIPLLLGVWGLVRVVLVGPDDGPVGPAEGLGVGAVTLIMLANSGDTVAAFIPLFAETADRYTPVIVGTGLVMALAWTRAARWMAGHPGVRRRVERWSPYLIPLILIGLGAYILTNTGTDVV